MRLTSHPYPILIIVMLILTIGMSFIFPYKPRSYDTWSCYFAIENFAGGNLTISNETHQKQVNEAQAGSNLRNKGQVHYIQITDNKWAYGEAPGYPLLMVPFQKSGLTRMLNITLLIGTVLFTYLLLRKIKDDKAAFYGSFLIICIPVSLAMFMWGYTPEFASAAFLTMGGALYLYHLIKEDRSFNAAILFAAALLIFYSVTISYSNIAVALMFTIHFAIYKTAPVLKGKCRLQIREAALFLTGAAIPLIILLMYNQQVFGSPFDFSYNHTNQPTKFIWDCLNQTGTFQNLAPIEILRNNLENMPVRLLLGFPELILVIPGSIYIMWQKGYLKRAFPNKVNQSDKWPELSKHFCILLIGWLILIFGIHFLYEYTAQLQNIDQVGIQLVTWDRYYLPAIFPIVVIAALVFSRIPSSAVFLCMMTTFGMGLIFLVQKFALYEFNSL